MGSSYVLHTTPMPHECFATCRMSHVACRMSHVACRMSHVACRSSHCAARIAQFALRSSHCAVRIAQFALRSSHCAVRVARARFAGVLHGPLRMRAARSRGAPSHRRLARPTRAVLLAHDPRTTAGRGGSCGDRYQRDCRRADRRSRPSSISSKSPASTSTCCAPACGARGMRNVPRSSRL